MDLIADRFLLRSDDTTIDLATGDRVELIVSTSGGVAEQTRWAQRCDRFARLHHQVIARLVDYGPIGEVRRFEAWRANGPWTGSTEAAERAWRLASEFLRASGWTDAANHAACLRQRHGRPIVVPDASAGFDDGESTERLVLSSISAVGILETAQPGLVAFTALFEDGAAPRGTTLALYGAPGSGRDTALAALARAARLNGIVPIASHLLERGVAPMLEGRSLALLVHGEAGQGWQASVLASLLSRKPRIAIFIGTTNPRGVRGVALGRLPRTALRRAVVPSAITVGLTKRVDAAARRAGGLPGRFAALIWGERNMRAIDGSKTSRAAEPALQYGETSRGASPPEHAGVIFEWPAPGELAALRKRLQAAVSQVGQGRHAGGERALRQTAMSLARRRDWEHAAEAWLALATSLLKRGRVRDAEAALAEARDAAIATGQGHVMNRIAIVTGVALIDDARLEEAEAVLGAAASAANGTGEALVARQATMALARCQIWQGRTEAAMLSLENLDDATVSDGEAFRLSALRCRLAIARQDFETAISRSAATLKRARLVNEPDPLATTAIAAAFAHLAVGDHSAVERDVAVAISAARRCHQPLQALRARLLSAESHRRQGQRRPGLTLCHRMRRMSSAALPAVVRGRVELLSDLLAREDGDDYDTAKRHARTSGLAALTLFVPARRAIDPQLASVADIVSILQCCQAADDEARVLAGLCARLRGRLRANGVTFFLEDGSSFAPIAFDGVRIDPALAARVAAVDQPITPHYLNGRLEAGAPVRYGGRRIGILLARWALGSDCDSKDVVVLLGTAATAAGPAVAAIANRRAAAVPKASELLGISSAIVEIRSAIERAAPAPYAVLVEGESGTGKELVARALHRQSSRRDRPFATLNCAALPDDLVESELFGHSRGAFTGALAERSGVFEEAHTGTLFLDEIGELSPRAQAKVLRTVQEGELRRVGENVARRIDVRLIAATNRELRQEVAHGRFRLDLLYRLDVIRISLPPLRSRRDDVAVLAEHFWRDTTARIGSRATLSLATLAQLARYDWPGNVRELQNVLAALAVRSPRRGVIQPSALPPQFDETAQPPSASSLEAARQTFDRQFIRAALARTGGHRARAARELGVTRQGLTKLMVRLGLSGHPTP